jgi:hypothetical protein
MVAGSIEIMATENCQSEFPGADAIPSIRNSQALQNTAVKLVW